MASMSNAFFTYPVLSNYNDDFVNVKFVAGTTGELNKTAKKSTIKTYVEIEDKNINDLIDKKQAEIIVKVYCSTTKFRNVYVINRGNDQIEINNRDINKNVEINTFIISKENIKKYYSDNFNSDYKEAEFEIEKGSILAIGKEENIFFEKDIDDLTKIESIIKVRDIKEENTPMSVDFDGENITNNLSTTEYNRYCTYSEYCISIVNSMIILPALMHVLNYLIDENVDSSEYKDKKWYRVLSKKITEATGQEFKLEYIRNHGAFEIVQRLFDYPLKDAMTEIERKYGGQ